MATFHGIQVYEILENGNILSGIYTRVAINKRYDIDSEIATKKKYDDKGVLGDYTCRYIETGNRSVIECDLQVLKYNGVYEFIWQNKGTIIWTGIGLLAGERHISVSYVEP